jgi:NAD(P)H-flavin reductase
MSAPAVSPPTANAWLPYAVRIADVRTETEGIATFELVLRDPNVAERYRFRPGQFNMLYLPGVGESAISMSGNPRDSSTLTHTVRLAGNVTHSLWQLHKGDELGLRGPFGSHWPIEQAHGQDLILVAGGLGLPPLRPAIYEMLADRADFGTASLLLGARYPEALLYPGEHDAWRAQGLDVQTTVDRPASGWNGNVGVVTLLLQRMAIPRPEHTTLFVCGPEIMMRYTVQAAQARGIPETQIWLSMERNMQCAVGLCGHCQWGPEFVCKDGPVFRYDRIAPYLYVEGL